MSIKKTIEVQLDLNPKELAEMFCNMGDNGQAGFFNEIAALANEWKYRDGLALQLQFITDNEDLTDDGRLVMAKIGEYSGKS